MRLPLLLAALVALPVPSAYAAATVAATSRTIPDYGGVSTSFSVVATGDQADDDLRAAGIYGDFHLALGVMVTDTAGAVASDGCEQVDTTTVRCMVPLNLTGNATIAAALDGGPGNDVLHASDVARSLAGGEGDDVLDDPDQTSADLDGGAGADRLVAPTGAGLAPLTGPTLDGGPGPDTLVGHGIVTYANRTAPVHVDLRKRGPVQGEAGEQDTIDGAQAIYGGHGDDTLIAGRARAWFAAGPGRDRLVGAAKSDTLSGGAGADLVEQVGSGDVVQARDGSADLVRCRRAPARVTADQLDLVLGCGAGRIVRRGAPRPRIVSVGRGLDVPGDGRTALVQVGCPDDMPRSCVATVAVRDRAGPAGMGVVAVRPGHLRVGRVGLTEAASRRARCSGQLRLSFELSYQTGDGHAVRVQRRLRHPVRRQSSAC